MEYKKMPKYFIPKIWIKKIKNWQKQKFDLLNV